VPVEVCDSEDNDFLGVDSVKQSIWEPVHQAAPDIQSNEGPALGVLGDVRDSRRDFLKELMPQPRDLQLVVSGCVEHLLLSRLHQANGLHCNRA